ncbi:hypothetical protein K2X33_15080 [bacterium]|nr:hypothetical protein [bacterium]
MFRSLAVLIGFSLALPACAANEVRPVPRTRQVANEPAAVPAEANTSTTVRSVEKPDDFNPFAMPYSVGIEGPSWSATSPLKESAVAIGVWLDKRWGYEVYVGYARTANGTSATTTTSTNVTAGSQTQTTVGSGTPSQGKFLLGGAIKYRIHQKKYFGVSTDLLATVNPGSIGSGITGSRTLTTPDTNDPNDYTITDTAYGTTTVTTDMLIRMGPRINVDYHLPWVPNILLGASFGIFMSIGGNTNTHTSTRTASQQVVNGVEQTPAAETTSVSDQSSSPGVLGDTYAIGGTGLGIGTGSGLGPITVTGTFRIRYTF